MSKKKKKLDAREMVHWNC